MAIKVIQKEEMYMKKIGIITLIVIKIVIVCFFAYICYQYINGEPELAIKQVKKVITQISKEDVEVELKEAESTILTIEEPKALILDNEENNKNTKQNTEKPNKGVIYLTFDDGPSTDITPKMLDILAEENVKATFFILNYTAATESLVKREAREGHSIGIHGYSHDYQKIYQSVDTYMENVTKLQNKIEKTTGITTYITRFPGGSSNTVSSYNPKIMTKLTKEVVKRGYKYYDWNVSSGDAGGAKNKDRVYRNVTKQLMKDRNNVVLMHDFSGNNKTLDALRAIIQYGKKKGYIFKPITQETPMITHPVNN